MDRADSEKVPEKLLIHLNLLNTLHFLQHYLHDEK